MSDFHQRKEPLGKGVHLRTHRPRSPTEPFGRPSPFGGRPATGGNLLSDFVRAQGIDRAFAGAFGRDKAPWATYSLPESLRHILDGYLLGLERIWHFEELEQEPLLLVKRGHKRLPDFTLLCRELARIDTPE
ncbi:hypothetical protein [Nitrospira sp. Kam-Ns4a]